eukprot:9877586-Prorocentrum_lima.AAC.1
MTSSLVGSEMCIRDRSHGCLIARGERFHVFSLGHGLPGAPVASKGNQTVSYTHLTLPTICSV